MEPTAALHSFHCPRWAELPSIPLYMDQVMIVLEDAIGLFADGEEKVLTSTMINNYVKQKLLDPPAKKKYSRQHLAVLIIITLLKKTLSMAEMAGLLQVLFEAYGIEKTYDMFCAHLEQSLTQTFAEDQSLSVSDATCKGVDSVLHAAMMALMGKLYLQQFLGKYSQTK